MRIAEAKVIVCSPGRNLVRRLNIVTEDGITGLGDATLNGRELAVVTYLRDHIVPLLVGRDARRIEDTWHYLYKGVYWRPRRSNDDRDCRGRHGLVGHRGQGREHAGVSTCSVARRATA